MIYVMLNNKLVSLIFVKEYFKILTSMLKFVDLKDSIVLTVYRIKADNNANATAGAYG